MHLLHRGVHQCKTVAFGIDLNHQSCGGCSCNQVLVRIACEAHNVRIAAIEKNGFGAVSVHFIYHSAAACPGARLLPRIPDYSPAKKLELEQHILQLAVTDHPLAAYEDKLKDLKLVPSNRLRRCAGKHVTVAGWLVTMRRAVTKNQEYMKFMTIEDRFGTMEVTLFPDTYQKYGHLLCTYGPYVVNAFVETEHRALTLTANWITTLDEIERVSAGDAA